MKIQTKGRLAKRVDLKTHHTNSLNGKAADDGSAEQRQSSAYARSLIEASRDPLFTVSTEGKITDMNQATVKITGLKREKLTGTDFIDYFTDPQKARDVYEEVFAKGFAVDYPLTM